MLLKEAKKREKKNQYVKQRVCEGTKTKKKTNKGTVLSEPVEPLPKGVIAHKEETIDKVEAIRFSLLMLAAKQNPSGTKWKSLQHAERSLSDLALMYKKKRKFK